MAFFLMMNLTLLLVLGLVLRCVMRLAIEMGNSKYWWWSKIFLIFYINYFNILDLAIWLVFSCTLFVVLCSVVSVALGDVGSMALKRMVVRKMVSLSIWHIGLCHLGMIFCVMDCLIFSVALLVVKRLTCFLVHCVVHLEKMWFYILKYIHFTY